MQKQKRIAEQESRMNLEKAAASRKRREDAMRKLGNREDAVMRGATEGVGWGLMAVGS